MTFDQILGELRAGRRCRRKSWGAPHYIYIDGRYPDKIVHIHDRSQLSDSDLLAGDWEVAQ